MTTEERILNGYPFYPKERLRLKKEVYSITELVDMGYPKKMLKKLLHSEDFSRFGFRTSPAKNSKAYINKEKLDRFLEHQMDEQQGVIAC